MQCFLSNTEWKKMWNEMTDKKLRYLIFIEEHSQLHDTNTQISLVKLIWNVPAKGTKFTSFLDQGMEKTQTIQHLVEFDLKYTNIGHPKLGEHKRNFAHGTGQIK